ncbi:mariner Mos1 transposase [Trichonephila clavipes]|nr:mariner Mos1 transposase [Trichonephila clavipes]
MGMIQKQGNWVPYELKPRDVERCLFACEQLLARQRRKGFLHRIATGDEKWHDNARPHVAKGVKTYLETLKWEVLPHPLYSPDLAPSDYHLFRSMAHGLADQHFRSYEEVKNWIESWIASKDNQFFQRGIRTLPER